MTSIYIRPFVKQRLADDTGSPTNGGEMHATCSRRWSHYVRHVTLMIPNCPLSFPMKPRHVDKLENRQHGEFKNATSLRGFISFSSNSAIPESDIVEKFNIFNPFKTDDGHSLSSSEILYRFSWNEAWALKIFCDAFLESRVKIANL